MAQNNENTERSCSAVTFCTGGCGFFGNSQFAGMCSKCYKDALKRKQATNSPQDSSAGRASPRAAARTSTPSYHSSIETASPTVPTVTVHKASAADTCTSSDTSTSLSAASAATAATILEEQLSSSPSVTPASSSKSEDWDQTLEERPATPSSETKTKKRNRCGACKKKVGLTGFECRCGGLYCSIHRYSDKHGCQFDYKKEGEDLIRKNNPVVVGAKLQRI